MHYFLLNLLFGLSIRRNFKYSFYSERIVDAIPVAESQATIYKVISSFHGNNCSWEVIKQIVAPHSVFQILSFNLQL